MTERLRQLEEQLRAAGKFWLYDTRLTASLSDDERIRLAELVLRSPKSWARGLAEEIQQRQYPPGFDEEEEE